VKIIGNSNWSWAPPINRSHHLTGHSVASLAHAQQLSAMRRRPEHRWPRARRRAQSSAAHVRGRLILSMSRPVLFFPPHCASLFHPHLVALLFNHHQSYHRAPPSTWVAAAPSVVAVALGHPRPLYVALPQASAAAESR
jgi:hypothetical protein